MAEYNSLVILGPTATGKTALAVYTAAMLGGEILSADSRQVYRRLDIGSGKDLNEYMVPKSLLPDTAGLKCDGEMLPVPYHLIDIAGLDSEYNLFNYQKDFYCAFADVAARGRLPVIAGGTGMYLDAVIRGYDIREVPADAVLRKKLSCLSMESLGLYLKELKPDLHNHTDLTERPRLVRAIEIEEFRRSNPGGTAAETGNCAPRPEIRPAVFGITFERPVLRSRIAERLRVRMDGGLIEEVEMLHSSGISWERLERLGLEYRFVSEYLQHNIRSRSELFRLLNIAIGQFAKRQETWFRGMERRGIVIHWIPPACGSIHEQFACVRAAL